RHTTRRRPHLSPFPYTPLFRSEPAGEITHDPQPRGIIRRLWIADNRSHQLARTRRRLDAHFAYDVGQHHAVIHFDADSVAEVVRSEEHTSELQSREHLVCRLLL